MIKLALLIAALSGLSAVHAEAPDYQVLPQLNGLSVNYHVQNNTLNTTLYATNHEQFAIVCDAAMTTDKQDKKRGQDKKVEPQTTAAFSFKHGTATKEIKLYLICEPTPEAKAAMESQATSKSTPSQKIEEHQVIIEDLESL